MDCFDLKTTLFYANSSVGYKCVLGCQTKWWWNVDFLLCYQIIHV